MYIAFIEKNLMLYIDEEKKADRLCRIKCTGTGFQSCKNFNYTTSMETRTTARSAWMGIWIKRWNDKTSIMK